MAERYCDHGAYGLGTNRIGRDVPAWGVPQEGDGTSKAAATAASIASISFSSVPTTGAASVFGATVSVTGVLSAANVNAAANVLAANINAAMTACSSFVSPAQAQLRNMVYARGPSNGAPTGTCQIMARVGSDNLNTATNTNARIVHSFNGSPTVSQFVGGSGGCWGWFINPDALGVDSSISAMNYGAFLYLPYAGTTPTLNDTINVRTGGGASKTIDYTNTTYSTIRHGAFSKRMLFDSNRIWTSDVEDGRLHLRLTHGAWGQTLEVSPSVGGQVTLYEAVCKGGFTVEGLATESAGKIRFGSFLGSSDCVFAYRGVRFVDSTPPGFCDFLPFSSESAGGRRAGEYFDCDYSVTYARTQITKDTGGILPAPGYAQQVSARFIGCTFDFNISSLADPGPILGMEFAGSCSLYFTCCSFLGYASGYLLTSASYPTSYESDANIRFRVYVDNCKGLRLPNSYFGLPTSRFVLNLDDRQIVHSAILDQDNPGFRLENARGVCEWVPNDPTPFPTAGAMLSITGAAWSMRLLWLTVVPLSRAWPFSAAPSRTLNPHATAARTVGVRLFLPSAVTAGLSLAVMYQDANGTPRMETATELQSDSTAWEGAALYPGFVARKLQVVTSHPIKQGTEIQTLLQLVGPPPSGPVLQVYYNPEPDVA